MKYVAPACFLLMLISSYLVASMMLQTIQMGWMQVSNRFYLPLNLRLDVMVGVNGYQLYLGSCLGKEQNKT